MTFVSLQRADVSLQMMFANGISAVTGFVFGPTDQLSGASRFAAYMVRGHLHEEGRSYDTIAERMRIPLGTAKTFVHRAKKKLQEVRGEKRKKGKG